MHNTNSKTYHIYRKRTLSAVSHSGWFGWDWVVFGVLYVIYIGYDERDGGWFDGNMGNDGVLVVFRIESREFFSIKG